MNIFAQTALAVPEPNSRRVRWLFIALFVIGASLRGYASFAAIALVHPDEHQQFVEQAHRLVYGYSVRFWEQERGARHPLYPALLAAPLATFEAVGLSDSLTQGALLRWMVSLLALVSCALFAWEFQRRGDSIAAITSMAVFALLPDVIYAQIHPLSEIAATVPFLLALIWIDRRPFLSGLALGLSFGLRFQMGFLIAAIVMLVWAQQRFRIDRSLARMAYGLAISLGAIGLSDRIMFGEWFHSPITYFTANLVEGVANVWGVEPWYQYFVWLGESSWTIFAMATAIVLVGAVREWRLGLLAVGFIVPHMLVGHKEGRFLLPIEPVLLSLGAVGLSEICRLLSRWQCRLFLTLATAALVAAAAVRLPEIAWNNEPFRSQAHLLHLAGQRDDLTGLGIFGYDHGHCGNYFYLRRNVPLYAGVEPDLEKMQPPEGDPTKRLNYMICWAGDRDRYARFRPVEVAACNGFGLYRLESPARLPQE